MTQADRVHSTPPTNTSAINPVDPTRRGFLAVAAGASVASVGTLAVAAAPAALALDAELIELGARFEPLVDRYYAARKVWAAAMTRAHSEYDREFPGAEVGERLYVPEIRAAWDEITKRSGLDDAADRLSAIWEEMEPIAAAINAASVTSIEGLRVKALVAFWQVAPFCAGDTTFHFEGAHPFQQLFAAVAEFCGLKEKMAATGYELPDIDRPDDDDSDDDGEEA
jgi:hypothetical protein